MTRETWFLAVENKHSGQRRAFLITDQLNEDQAQLFAEALEGQFPTLRILPVRASELDDVEVLLWREQCRKADTSQRYAPVTGRIREPASDREIRTIRATADRMLPDIVAPAAEQAEAIGETRPMTADGTTSASEVLPSSQDAAAAPVSPTPTADTTCTRRDPKPGRETRKVSLAKAARDWFKMSTRTLKRSIKNGLIAAKQISDRQWQFDIDAVEGVSPGVECEPE